MDISGLFQNGNIFNIAATGAAIWVFVTNWWVLIILAFIWLVSRNKGDKADETKNIPKHLPTKVEVFKMLTDLYLK